MPAPPSDARRALVAPALRFLVAGGLNAALNYVLFRAFLHLMGGRPSAAGAAQAGAYVIGVAVAYAVNRRWTFRDGGARDGGAEAEAAHRRALPRFLATYLGTLALSTALVQAGVTAAGLSPSAAWVLATAVTTVVNFLAQRYWVFPARPAPAER